MEVLEFFESIRRHPDYDGQLGKIRVLAERPARYAEPTTTLSDDLMSLLRVQGLSQLYVHQAQAVDAAMSGHDFVVVTGTASGKTLCYNLPIFETCLADDDARALYLFPTKALAQDQLKGLLELIHLPADQPASGKVSDRLRPGVYDGDTPTAQRRRIRAEANLVLSNPDMLHAAVLPYHPKWARFFSDLKFIVLDEVHTYRGILGANVAAVLRRVLRVCEHYGSRPVILSASATIANPGELTSKLTGRDVQVIDEDGAPRGRKYFAFWNPSPLGKDQLARRSANDDAVWLMSDAVEMGAQTLAFTRTRQAAELVNRYVQEELRNRGSSLHKQVRAYRGGYLPDERRQIEKELFEGRLTAVASTNALELGVDIGSLDVALLVNYPGTIASAWQQAGRSGRRHTDSLAVLIAGNDPVDQYMLRHPDYFFAQSPEHAVVDPDNPYVLAKHLKAAAFELPLEIGSAEQFGELAPQIADVLVEAGDLSAVAGQYYFSGGQNPAQQISLRHMSDNTFSIVLRDNKDHIAGAEFGTRRRQPQPNQVIANVDAISAPELIYPEAVYLHNGESYFVRELDMEGRVAYVERHDMDYYTQAVLDSNVKIEHEQRTRDIAMPARLAYGDVDVSWKTVSFKKIKFETRENVGFGSVDLPEQNLPTTALWLTPSDDLREQLRAEKLRLSEGLCGIRNLAVVALPMVSMCDSRDISGVVDSKNLGRSTLILYDRYPGGLGYCEKGYEQVERLLAICYDLVEECECYDGCPSCVGLPNLRPAIHSDPDLTRGYPIPSKEAAHRLLALLLQSSEQLAIPG